MDLSLQKAIEIVKRDYQTPEAIDIEQAVISKYGQIFNPKNLDNLTAEDFKSFLLFKNNKHWHGISRYASRITSDMTKLKNVLKLLLDESLPIKERLDKIRPKNKPPLVKGLGRAVLTPILLMVYPDKYCVYNFRVEQGLKRFGLFPSFKKESFSEEYIEINKIIKDLAKKYGLTLWQIDCLWAINPEEAAVANYESRETSTYFSADTESHLESFLIDNWDSIPGLQNWEIYAEEDEYIGQQYDTKKVGIIDILCRDKNTGDFVVVELKKSRASDKVVGQVLRYIGWVKENLAKDKNVYGIILTYAGDKDLRLEYALKTVKDLIKIKFYKINITIE